MNRSQNETLLVVSHRDDESEQMAAALRAAGQVVRMASDADEALESYRRQAAAVAIVDRDLPGRGGEDLLAQLRAHHDEAVVIVLGESPDVEQTVRLMHAGAFHVLTRPVAPEQLRVVVSKALEHGRLSRGNRDLKNQLDISEKLAMIGRLASGVAHELNNPLDGVRRYVRLTQEGLDREKQELGEYLDRAMSGLGRMASIVRQLLTFSRNVVIENEAENLRTMLDDVVRTLAPTGSAAPVIELVNPYLDVRVPRVMFQVFANLVRNALDAVESRGARGTVKVIVTRGEQGDVEVRVQDNGTGIAPDDLRRVFEPFFTTKEVGKGTGLGLPISARIAERCGGSISIESEPNRGTTVHVVLPIESTVAAHAPAAHGAER